MTKVLPVRRQRQWMFAVLLVFGVGSGAFSTQIPTIRPAVVGVSIPLLVNATDNVGVTKVELRANGQLFDTVLTPPWDRTWTPMSPGIYMIQATAYDAAGNTGTSNLIEVRASSGTPSIPPQASPNCTRAATVVDTSGGVWTLGTFQEQTLRNGTWVGGSHASTYLLADGRIYIRTMASDQHWAVWDGTAFQMFGLTEPPCSNPPPPPITVADTLAPTGVSFTITPTVPLAGQQVTFNAVASDNVGVTRVAFRAYGVEVASATALSAPFRIIESGALVATLATYTATWTPTVIGPAFLRVFAFDAAGNQGESPVMDVIVMAAPTPLPPSPPYEAPWMPTVPTPQPILTSVPVMSVGSQCRITVPNFRGSPDGQYGWTVQIQRNGLNHGQSDSTSDLIIGYGPKGGFTALVGLGTYVMTAKWTKSGQLMVTWPLGTRTCP